MKDNPISIGIDDSAFKLKSNQTITQLIGVVCQGTRMVNVIKTEIQIDGDNSTEGLIELIKRTEKHIQYVFTDSITFGGFNIADIETVYKKTGKPIIAISEKEIDLPSVIEAIKKKFNPEFEQTNRFQKIINAGNLYQTEVNTAGGMKTVNYHCKGIKVDQVKDLLERVCIDSKLPECVRMAHIIGSTF